jgi:riboflavin synthase alpha subunit
VSRWQPPARKAHETVTELSKCRNEADEPQRAQTRPGGSHRDGRRTARSSLPGVFTGIVRERGRLVSRDGGPDGVELVVEARQTAAGTHTGDSVAVDGVCLTATDVSDGRLGFHAVTETLRRSTLAALAPGARVNVEPALKAGEPLGGHYVQGHVDGVGHVTHAEPEGDGKRLRVEAPPELLRYCVLKGSIAVQGVSLTVAALDDDAFEVTLVPHTLAATTLGDLGPGDPVNLEVDVLAKYVERLVAR